MDIYLPIAEISVNLFLILGLGGAIGFLSGAFGIGGGFLMTPLLIFIGIPPSVAVGSGTVQILASSVSGVLAQLRRRAVDTRIGMVLIAGGFVGSTIGILVFKLIRALGQIDTFISLSYVVLLGAVGLLMLTESLGAIFRRRRLPDLRRRLHQHYWLHGLPLKMRFPKSRLYISAITPFVTGLFIGLLTAGLGVGGGFILIPAMIYLIGMPTGVVVGTSLLQLAFVTGLSGFLHAFDAHTVDIVLSLLLIAGGVVGAQFGSRAGAYLRGDQLRILLAIIVLAVCGRLVWGLVVRPPELYSIAVGVS